MKHRKTKPAVVLARLMRATAKPETETVRQLPALQLRADRYWKVRS